jgi:hypothetical protein
MKHPRETTSEELETLPVAKFLDIHQITFISRNYQIWDVGQKAGALAKTLAPTSPPMSA